MGNELLHSSQSERLPDAFAPRLLVETEPAYQAFFRNLVDVLFPRRLAGYSNSTEWPGLWTDVFVSCGLPWWRFLESFAFHVLVIAGVWGASRVWLLRPQVAPPPVFSKRDVIYFPVSEYLQPLDTGAGKLLPAQKGEPEFSKQAILSVPPQADNRTQTVVTPPDVKLKSNIALPNMVAWKSVAPAAPSSAISRLQLPPEQPAAVIAPPPTLQQAADRRRLDQSPNAVIAPPPEFAEVNSRPGASAPAAADIDPPPAVHGQIRRLGQINIASSDVVPPAPQLPIAEQHPVIYSRENGSGNLLSSVVPPPPQLAGASAYRQRPGASIGAPVVAPPPSSAGSAHSQNRIVALNLHPVATAPPLANGNRRGTFALTPTGRPGAAGTPNIAAGSSARGQASDLPSGLFVKQAPEQVSSAAAGSSGSAAPNTLLAEAKPPLRVAPGQRRAMASTSEPTAEERQVFGNRKFYSMTLNMPNLNSAGGSWVIRFAELRDSDRQGDLLAPEAIRKVDPAYPLELMRTQIQGKVTLSAVIHSDGSVGDVRVLTSVDDRLDQYACAALQRWRFHPAMKAGDAVALQAVVTIPFRARPAF